MTTLEKISKPSFAHKYPIISFFILAVALGAGTVYLVMWRRLPSELALASVFSSSIAGIIITAIVDGEVGLKLMF
jgi:hypothetical protein